MCRYRGASRADQDPGHVSVLNPRFPPFHTDTCALRQCPDATQATPEECHFKLKWPFLKTRPPNWNRHYRMVDLAALLAALDREKVNPSTYAVAGAGLDDLPKSDLEERYVLAIAPGGWCVFYRERGRDNDRLDFDTEDEACDEMLMRVTGDPTTRRA
jgi:hypothetical protein